MTEFKTQIKKANEKHKIHNSNLIHEENEALISLRKNKNITISKADKGNAVVIQNCEDFENKMTALVNDNDYEKSRSDPTKTIVNKIASLIKKSTEFDAHTRRLLTPKFSKPPHIYGLIKIHKENFPIHPIVSGIDSPCYQLAKYLFPILNPLVDNTDSYIKNTSEFVEKVSTKTLTRKYLVKILPRS
jgi:hypothetical protein